MKKELRVWIVISAVVLLTVFFSAISCSIQPGPIPGTFSVTIHNHHGWQTLSLYKNGFWETNIVAGGSYFDNTYLASDYVEIFNLSATIWLHDAGMKIRWYTNAFYTFDYFGGGVIDVGIILSPQKE